MLQVSHRQTGSAKQISRSNGIELINYQLAIIINLAGRTSAPKGLGSAPNPNPNPNAVAGGSCGFRWDLRLQGDLSLRSKRSNADLDRNRIKLVPNLESDERPKVAISNPNQPTNNPFNLVAKAHERKTQNRSIGRQIGSWLENAQTRPTK